MKRIDAIRRIVAAAGDDVLIVCNIGLPCRELYAVGDRPGNFYMLGSMGLASSIGLGLALSQPNRRVITIDGDGSVLMNLGTLATIGNHAPDKYLLIIVDNGAYGSSGNQPTHTTGKTDLADMARGAGIAPVYTTDDPGELESLVQEVKSGVIVVNAAPGNADVPVIDLPPGEILRRFMDECDPGE